MENFTEYAFVVSIRVDDDSSGRVSVLVTGHDCGEIGTAPGDIDAALQATACLIKKDIAADRGWERN